MNAFVGDQMAKLRLVNPWWLEAGTEICPMCHHLYLYETEYRCAGCDAPACSSCVEVKRSVPVVCLRCLDSQVSFDEVGVEVL